MSILLGIYFGLVGVAAVYLLLSAFHEAGRAAARLVDKLLREDNNGREG